MSTSSRPPLDIHLLRMTLSLSAAVLEHQLDMNALHQVQAILHVIHVCEIDPGDESEGSCRLRKMMSLDLVFLRGGLHGTCLRVS